MLSQGSKMQQLQQVEKITDTFTGSVLHCENKVINEHVAVKRFNLPSSLKDDQQLSAPNSLKAAALNERDVMLLLKAKGGHENLVQLYDVIYEPSKLYLVMEYCAAGDLCTYVETRKALDNREAADIFRELVTAVSYLHSVGFAHRNLTLENILMDENNVLKLCDFGAVVPVNQVCKTVAGRKRYMAPEVLVAETRNYHPCEADIWSLGIILFTLLTGKFLFRRPKKGYPSYEYFVQNGVRALVSKYKLTHRVPPAAMDLLEQMIRVDPTHRIQLPSVLKHPFLNSGLPKGS